jgi:hypothetical protein
LRHLSAKGGAAELKAMPQDAQEATAELKPVAEEIKKEVKDE